MRRPMHGDTLTRQAGDLSVRPHKPRRARKPGPAAGRSAQRPEIPPTEGGAVAMNTAGAGDVADLGSVLLCAIIDGCGRLAVFAEMAPWRPADLTKQSSPVLHLMPPRWCANRACSRRPDPAGGQR